MTATKILTQLHQNLDEATEYYSKLQAECNNRVELAKCKTRLSELKRFKDAIKDLNFNFEE